GQRVAYSARAYDRVGNAGSSAFVEPLENVQQGRFEVDLRAVARQRELGRAETRDPATYATMYVEAGLQTIGTPVPPWDATPIDVLARDGLLFAASLGGTTFDQEPSAWANREDPRTGLSGELNKKLSRLLVVDLASSPEAPKTLGASNGFSGDATAIAMD